MKKFITGDHQYQHTYEVFKKILLVRSGVIEGELLKSVVTIYNSAYENGLSDNVTGAYIFLEKMLPHIKPYIEPFKEYVFTYQENFPIDEFEQTLEDMVECVLQLISDRKDNLTISSLDMMFFDVDRTNEYLFY